jgi:hypothetical protein
MNATDAITAVYTLNELIWKRFRVAGWCGLAVADREGDEELPIHAQGRTFLVAADWP